MQCPQCKCDVIEISTVKLMIETVKIIKESINYSLRAAKELVDANPNLLIRLITYRCGECGDEFQIRDFPKGLVKYSRLSDKSIPMPNGRVVVDVACLNVEIKRDGRYVIIERVK